MFEGGLPDVFKKFPPLSAIHQYDIQKPKTSTCPPILHRIDKSSRPCYNKPYQNAQKTYLYIRKEHVLCPKHMWKRYLFL